MPVDSAAQASDLSAKLDHFKSAVDAGKGDVEQVHGNRYDRYKQFVAAVKSYDSRISKDGARRFRQHERRSLLAKSKLWTTADFQAVSVLGEGSFGIVYLAKKKGCDEFFALKQMKKTGFTRKNCRDRIFAERDILAEAQSRWIVDLYQTFQDADYVYMVMEFLQGGDLIGHILRRKRLSHNETRFYMAELLEALDTVHRCGFIHRDVKPDNMVLTPEGHLKLLDFGLCSHDPMAMLEEQTHIANPGNRRAQFKSTVGTPQYMAVEVYQGAYGQEADLWSLGIITYECLVGIVPFHGDRYQGREAIKLIRSRIMQHETALAERLAKAKARGYIAQESEDFLRKLICVSSLRLNAEQCRRHPFFEGLNFCELHELVPPIVPSVSSSNDTDHFDKFPFRELPEAETGARKDVCMEWLRYDFDKESKHLGRKDLDVGGFFQKTLPKKQKAHSRCQSQQNFSQDQIVSPSPNANGLMLASFLQAYGHQDDIDIFI